MLISHPCLKLGGESHLCCATPAAQGRACSVGFGSDVPFGWQHWVWSHCSRGLGHLCPLVLCTPQASRYYRHVSKTSRVKNKVGFVSAHQFDFRRLSLQVTDFLKWCCLWGCKWRGGMDNIFLISELLGDFNGRRFRGSGGETLAMEDSHSPTGCLIGVKTVAKPRVKK